MSDDLVKRLRYGIVEHRKRWSGDTHADLGGSVDYDATTDMLHEAADRIAELEAELREAQDRSNAFATKEYHTEVRAEAAEAKLAKAVEALLNIDCKLTNMQPKIANGLLNEVQLAWVDQYVDPCICEARATLAELKGETDE